MRYLKIALVIALVILVPVRRMHAGGPQYDPPPLPDIPWPDDPPDVWDIPFPDPPDLPDPIDIPLPPEDPEDPFPLPPPPDFPDPPDIPDVDDPFPDLPSLDPGDIGGYGLLVNYPGFSSTVFNSEARQAASNAYAKLMPFPNRLPFHPAYSGVNAPRTTRKCDPATASNLLVPETGRNTVAYVSTCPFKIVQRVTVGGTPIGIAVTPDGQFAWVTNADDGTVSVINISAASVVATIHLPAFSGFQAEPNNIAFLPDGSTAYVTNHDANPGSVVYVIDVASRTVTKQIPVGAFPASMAVTPDGTQVWVPCRGDSDLFVIDTLTNTVVGFNANINLATGVAFTPNGSKAYVAEGVELSGYIDVIDMTTFQIVNRIQVGNLPHVLAVTPSGHHLFVTNALSGTIMQIDTSTDKVLRTIPVGNHPLGITFIQ